jgi:hypothetical protein
MHACQLAFSVWSPEGQRLAYVGETTSFWSEGQEDWVVVNTKLSSYVFYPGWPRRPRCRRVSGDTSFIVPMGDGLSARVPIDLMYNGVGTSGPPVGSLVTSVPEPTSQSVVGTAFDSDEPPFGE